MKEAELKGKKESRGVSTHMCCLLGDCVMLMLALQCELRHMHES